MKIYSGICTALGLGISLVFPVVSAHAEAPPPASPTASPEASTPPSARPVHRVTLQFQDLPIRDALDILFKGQTSVSYVLDNAIPDSLKVTATFKDHPFDAALNAILRSARLRAIRKPGFYSIFMRYPPILAPPEVNQPPLPDSQLPTEAPADFDFRFQYGVDGLNVLDTFRNTFTKDMIANPSVTIPMALTRQERLRIYRKMVAIRFFSYPDDVSAPNRSPTVPSSNYFYKVRWNRQTKFVLWSDPVIDQSLAGRHLEELAQLILEIIQSKPAYRQLPSPQGAYL